MTEFREVPFSSDTAVRDPGVGVSGPSSESLEFQERLEASIDLERALGRRLVRNVAAAIPLFVGLWVGLVALAVAPSGVGLSGPLAMAAGFGVLAALFFGSWAAVVSLNAAFEELDRETSTVAVRGPTPRTTGDRTASNSSDAYMPDPARSGSASDRDRELTRR